MSTPVQAPAPAPPTTGRTSSRRSRAAKPQYPVQIRPDGSRDVELPLREHLIELRGRLIKTVLIVVLTTALSIFFMNQIAGLLTRLAQGHELIAISPTETFVSYIKMAFYTGIALSMPFIVYQLFRFLAPGLTKSERRWILASLPAITILFVTGILFCYFIVLPSAIGFLFNFGESSGVTTTVTISNFLSFVTRFLMAVGIAFETPVIIFLLAKLGIATPKRLRRFRRWAYVLAFVIAAIITPTPDPINQIIVAVPIILLYELGTLLARFGVRTPQST
jgi:sec-independent protein translocase protein TatC